MRIIVVTGIVAAVAALTIACSGSSTDPVDDGQSAAQDLSATAKKCPAGEKKCTVQKKDGSCGTVCVIDTALCIAPPVCSTPVCEDPNSPQPHPGCTWDAKACQWDCPVCDPLGGQPHAGCSWDTKTCQWDCPVCDPPPPPKPGCSWDSTHCVWLCL
ncbi:MAG TPA: hypothetical protein VIF62_23640 [Labilithrix sp.]|jgi:hypothetical protein